MSGKLLIITLSFLILPAQILAQIQPQGQLQTQTPDNPQDKKEGVTVEPIIVNGDVVEFSTETKEFTATGNVEVLYKGTKLTCQKLTLNSETKDAVAQGNARLDEKEGVIEGESLTYNFKNKAGIIIDAGFRSNPYFGKSKKADKVSDAEFIFRKGYISTCALDNPHWRLKSRRMNFFPDDKVQIKDAIFYAGTAPLMYLPTYNRSLKDPMMHVQVDAGKSKIWGPYVLSAWRYNLAENLTGRVYFDVRSKLGVAEGFGANYTTKGFGKGDFKYYYTQERDKTRRLNESVDTPKVFQRYLIRERHKWDINEQTNLITEYYKIIDSRRMVIGPQEDFLKDYFFREYEKVNQPASYLTLHHSFSYSSIDLYLQKRANRWYDPGYLERLPEVKYSIPSFQIGITPFYFSSDSSVGNYNKKNTSTSTPAANALNPDVHVNRLDTTNKFSLPMKASFIQFTPFVSNRETFYDKDVFGERISPRTVFSSGADMSTKFYRIFNIKSNLLGMNINGLRHIITPGSGYSYSHNPTILSSRLKQVDGVDSIAGSSNPASLSLSNKLQTKRNNQSVDLVDFLVSNTYTFKPKTGDKRGSNLGDFSYKLKILPYAWLRMEGDATYKHSGNRSDSGYKRFTNANYDVYFDFGQDRNFGFGQRYQRKGGNEITYSFKWRLNPKWKFSFYQRRMRGHAPSLNRGLKEQEYSIIRDLHCWEVDMTYNGTKGKGSSIWFIFRLKAFPEMEFGFQQDYHVPKTGTERNN